MCTIVLLLTLYLCVLIILYTVWYLSIFYGYRGGYKFVFRWSLVIPDIKDVISVEIIWDQTYVYTVYTKGALRWLCALHLRGQTAIYMHHFSEGFSSPASSVLFCNCSSHPYMVPHFYNIKEPIFSRWHSSGSFLKVSVGGCALNAWIYMCECAHACVHARTHG